MKMDKKYFPQTCLEECKYKIKKTQTPRFINAELDLDSGSDAESDSESDETSGVIYFHFNIFSTKTAKKQVLKFALLVL